MLYAEESEVPIEEYPFMSVNRVCIYIICVYNIVLIYFNIIILSDIKILDILESECMELSMDGS